MKIIEKERTKVEKYTVYQAIDGTEFIDEKNCNEYENSAKGVLRGKFMQLAVCPPQNAWELMGGYDDHTVVAVKIPDKAAKDVVRHTYYLDNSWLLTKDRECRKNEFDIKVEQAFCNNDLLLFGLNCEDELYIINTRQNIIDNLNNLDNLDKQEEQNV